MTILANSLSGANAVGAVTDKGYNLCSDASCLWTTSTSLSNTDPKLGPLADNGGPTPTLALLPGSPAIDAGNPPEAPAADQRGVPRPVGKACDIGAFESGLAIEPPTITTEPVAQTVLESDTVSFQVTAAGYLLNYQWLKDGRALAGQTNTSLILSNVRTKDAGHFAAVVSNDAGSVTSQVAVLTVRLLPASGITTGPLSQTVVQGASVDLRVAASGDFLAYQWLKTGLPLHAQTNNTLNLMDVQIGDAGNYAVVVSNASGSVTSQVAVLTVLLRLTVTLQPWSPTALVTNVGATVTFTAVVSNTAPVICQWSKDGATIIGTTNTVLVLNNVQFADSGKYSVAISNQTSYGATEVTLLVATLGDYFFRTLAGKAGIAGYADGPGNTARFAGPYGIAVDSKGNVYVADTGTIRKVSAEGMVTTVAGLAGSSGSAGGTGSTARFNLPHGVAVDSVGNVYVADDGNATIRKISPSGVVTTMAGKAGMAGFADGWGSATRFGSPGPGDPGPRGVAVDLATNVYVADNNNHAIRMVSAAGWVTTLAGKGGIMGDGSADGIGSAALFFEPAGVAVDGTQNVYVADTLNFTIRKIGPGGVVSTVAGKAGSSGSTDGTGSAARFNQPSSVAVDSNGNIFVADTLNNTIRKITLDRVVTTLAGRAGIKGSADGLGNAARFNYPWGVAVDSAGNVYVADNGNNTIRIGTNIFPAPLIITGPMSQTALAGANVTFNVVAGGTPPLSYQWLFNSIPLPGQTNATLTLVNMQVAQAGLYTVTVSNLAGTVTSPSATLTVTTAITLLAIQLKLPQYLANGQFQMTLAANTNQAYVIQVSTNLTSWLDWTNVSPISLNTLLADPDAMKYRQRFYRAIKR